jgi:hypothetical protein
MLVRTFASAVTGIDAVAVTIEVNVSFNDLSPYHTISDVAFIK